MSDREKEVDSMRDILNEKVDRVEELLQNVAKSSGKGYELCNNDYSTAGKKAIS